MKVLFQIVINNSFRICIFGKYVMKNESFTHLIIKQSNEHSFRFNPMNEEYLGDKKNDKNLDERNRYFIDQLE